MNLTELLGTQALVTPWPTLVSGKPIIGSQLTEAATCTRKCGSNRECANTGNPGENQCRYGMSFFKEKIVSENVVVYGVRGSANTTPLNKYNRKGLKGRSITIEQIKQWGNRISNLKILIEKEFQSRQSEMLDPLHDPVRLAKQINTIANRLVQIQSHGTTFEQQIDNASVELKTLIKAADLLSDSFDLLTIYFNPDAATFGRRSAVSLHGLITKLISIFRIDDGGVSRSSTKIYLSGTCYRNVFIYESFKLIPFALLSNAVKYSIQGNIEVVVDDRRQHIELSVSSTGPFIEEDERMRIFQKKGRGKWAEKYIDGKGVGLYLADLIAKAHATSISVISNKTGNSVKGIPIARNTFSVHVPISS
jgi:signal transduction histidine kinase